VRSPLDGGRLRGRLAAGEGTVGTFLGLASPAAAEVCAAAGPDWLVLDQEHGGGGEEQISPTLLADALGAELAAARTGGSRGGGG
jgi:2-dehydro-3-deoxyglucarate aldolase/4-hydroxy-2-oxoheptanedioate aldolase